MMGGTAIALRLLRVDKNLLKATESQLGSKIVAEVMRLGRLNPRSNPHPNRNVQWLPSDSSKNTSGSARRLGREGPAQYKERIGFSQTRGSQN